MHCTGRNVNDATVNTLVKALAEIYTIHTVAQISDLKMSIENCIFLRRAGGATGVSSSRTRRGHVLCPFRTCAGWDTEAKIKSLDGRKIFKKLHNLRHEISATSSRRDCDFHKPDFYATGC